MGPPKRQTLNRRVCFVLHSHLPWLPQHGTWPVGEEWLYQAYAHSYIPLLDSLRSLGGRGFRDVASVAITPVLAAQLDNPYTLDNLAIWLRNWQLRALQVPTQHPARDYVLELAHQRIDNFDRHFSRGASPTIRSLIDTGVIEVLGGPLAHPFTPHVDPDIHRYFLQQGLLDSRRRWDYQPAGIWVPECAYKPGQEDVYAEVGVRYFLVDEPAVSNAGGAPNRPYKLHGGPVTVIARDIEISDHIWSAERGYPGRPEYQDFHDINIEYGLHLSRVGEKSQFPKASYIPDDADNAIERDAIEFISALSTAFEHQEVSDSIRVPLIVIAIDTELLGHWWHEGVRWFTRVIELLPEHGIKTATLDQVTRHPRPSIQLGESSWGAGKDWRLWTGDPVRDLVVMNHQAQEWVREVVNSATLSRSQESDLLNELSHLLSSDWAFMVSRDSAADYARSRAVEHFQRIRSIVESPGSSSRHLQSMHPFYLNGPIVPTM